jgi:hypothetical protein
VYPHSTHKFFTSAPAIVSIHGEFAILASRHFLKIVTNGKVATDAVGDELSVLGLSSTDSSFVFGTAFECLLLLKHLLFVVKKEFVLLKSCFLDLVIAQSPYVFGFLPEFADFLTVCRPSSPFDNSEEYQHRLMIFGSLLRNGSFSDSFHRFLAQELRMLGNASSRGIAKFFPEFLTSETEPPQSSLCEVAIIPKDPCHVQANVINELMVISFTSRKYETLVGYPFWEILPFWLAITGPSLIGPPGESVGFCERVSQEIMRIVNQSRVKSVECRLKAPWLIDSIVLVDQTRSFDNPLIFSRAQLRSPILLKPGGHMFLSIMDLPGGWESVEISLNEVSTMPLSMELDVSTIKESFISDLQEFVLSWSDDDTQELLWLIPRSLLWGPLFAPVESIARSSSLCQKFSVNVVLIKAVMLHHFNQFRLRPLPPISKSICDSLPQFVNWEEGAEFLSRDIVRRHGDGYCHLTIDRRLARQLIDSGQGDPRQCTISQLTGVLHGVSVPQLQNRRRPWHVTFCGELR